MSTDLYTRAKEIIGAPPFRGALEEYFDIQAREPQYVPLPRYLSVNGVGRWFASVRKFINGLYIHQAEALNHLRKGRNVVATTDTSSGKSSIAIAHALYLLDQNSDAVTLGIYPSKALQSDQIGGWKTALDMAGHKASEIGIINGDDKDHKRRLKILKTSKIVLMTPDVIHSWLMNNLDAPEVRDFFRKLEFQFLDEAHSYDDILGSNAPRLFRRMQFAADAIRNESNPSRIQTFAASASLNNARGFMRDLVGAPFFEVKQDGSRKSRQYVAHIDANENEQKRVARDLILRMLGGDEEIKSGAGICFIDSRPAVERLAAEINAKLGQDVTTSYVGGYTEETRDEIQIELRKGKRRFVICTSVLEMGVDFPNLTVGITVGQPKSPASLIQRLGRVGRGIDPAMFIILAPGDTFKSYTGRRKLETENHLREYCTSSATITIYPDHPHVLATNVLSLAHEMKQLKVTALNDRRYGWGQKFTEMFERHQRGEPILDEESASYLRGRKDRNPHVAFPIRQIETPGRTYDIIYRASDGTETSLGTIDQRAATQECYPGALLWRRMEKYEAIDWKWLKDRRRPIIRVKKVRTLATSYARRERAAFFDLPTPGHKLPGAKCIVTARGRIMECRMKIIDQVIGYARSDCAEPVYYPKTERYQHYTSTSGVVIDFRREHLTEEQLGQLGQHIIRHYADQHSISPLALDYMHTQATSTKWFIRQNVLQNGKEGPEPLGHALIIYDRNPSRLQLTTKLIAGLPDVIEAIVAPEDRAIRGIFQKFYERVTDKSLPAAPKIVEPTETDSGPIIVPGNPALLKTERKSGNGTHSPHMEVVMVEKFVRGPNGEPMYEITKYHDPLKRKPGRKRGNFVRRVAAKMLMPAHDT